jgi:hypothetical protein
LAATLDDLITLPFGQGAALCTTVEKCAKQGIGHDWSVMELQLTVIEWSRGGLVKL